MGGGRKLSLREFNCDVDIVMVVVVTIMQCNGNSVVCCGVELFHYSNNIMV